MIGNVVQKIERYEPVQETKTYRLLGMRSKIGGPFIRETKSGAEISAKKAKQGSDRRFHLQSIIRLARFVWTNT